MEKVKNQRIESIDLLRGVVMILMALDHTRDYFHLGVPNPTDLETTTPFLFFTRFITHYCAPTFVFLAGTAAYLYGAKKPKAELFKFLFSRGIWLMFLELVLNNLLWWFDIGYDFILLQVIWAIGLCMAVLSLIIYLPIQAIFALGLLIVFGHNALDSIVMEGDSLPSILWYIVHQSSGFPLSESRYMSIGYPMLPWLGIMLLGYCLGTMYTKDFDGAIRRKWLLRLGIASILAFFLIRGLNVYGDMKPWEPQKDAMYTFLAFMKVSKYPPSLVYTLITLGPGLLFLYFTDQTHNQISRFFVIFGRVPLFYYFSHVLVIHLAQAIPVLMSGGTLGHLILDSEAFNSGAFGKYGYSLGGVYLVWVCVILVHYPMCKWYMEYKQRHKEQWWLSYL